MRWPPRRSWPRSRPMSLSQLNISPTVTGSGPGFSICHSKMPTGIAALAVVAGDDRAELPLRQPHGELVPVVLEPGIGEQTVVGAGALGQIPVPAGERLGPDRRKDVGRTARRPWPRTPRTGRPGPSRTGGGRHRDAILRSRRDGSARSTLHPCRRGARHPTAHRRSAADRRPGGPAPGRRMAARSVAARRTAPDPRGRRVPVARSSAATSRRRRSRRRA